MAAQVGNGEILAGDIEDHDRLAVDLDKHALAAWAYLGFTDRDIFHFSGQLDSCTSSLLWSTMTD